MAQTILRIRDVRSRTGMSRSSIYAAIRRGEFPKQVQLSRRSVGWLETAIQQWISSRRFAVDAQPAGGQSVSAGGQHA